MKKNIIAITAFIFYFFVRILLQRYEIKMKGGISLGGSSWSDIWHSMPIILISSTIIAVFGQYIVLKHLSNNISKEKIRNLEIKQNNSEPYTSECRICGYSSITYPWGTDGASPSFEICPCCGVQFGKEDRTLEAIKAYRAEWIRKGGRWFSKNEKPVEWDMDAQLKNIPKNFV
jgi:hypothetical protein